MKNFQYENIPSDTAFSIKAATERIRLRMKRTAEDIIEIGRDLIEVKDALPHGQFGDWLKAEFEMSEWTARNFTNVADKFGTKTGKIPDFTPSILYELSAPSTPEPVVEQAIQKADDGERITVADVKKWKAAHKKSQDKISELEEEIEGLQKLPPTIVERLPEGFQDIHRAVEAKQSELGEIKMQIQTANKKLEKMAALKKENAALKKGANPGTSTPLEEKQIPAQTPFLSKETAILAMKMASDEVIQGGRPRSDVREYFKFLEIEHTKIGEVVAGF